MRRLIPALLMLLLVAGCRNPFNPSAKVRFERFLCGSGYDYYLSIDQGTANDLITGMATFANGEKIATRVIITNPSTVHANITGYSVVYKQVSTGLPIASCGGAAGRRFSCLWVVPAMWDNTQNPGTSSFRAQIVTSELVSFIATNLSTTSGGIDCEVTFYGEDGNGYDVKLEATLHIDVF